MSDEIMTLSSDRLTGLTRRCPECGTLMTSTGKMFYQPVISEWAIEYWCPNDRELFTVFAPETKQIADDIAKSVKPSG